MMDANESDAVLLELVGEVRQLRAVLPRVVDALVLVNQTCQRILETADRLDARVTLLAAGGE